MKIVISPFSQKLRNGKENPKNYPYWKELIMLLPHQDNEIIQIGVSGEEQLVPNAKFDMKIPELREFIQDMDMFLSVDNFFPHFCHHYGKHGVVLWGRSNPEIFGYPENLNLLRDTKYLREDQYGMWESTERIIEAFVHPIKVLEAMELATVQSE